MVGRATRLGVTLVLLCLAVFAAAQDAALSESSGKRLDAIHAAFRSQGIGAACPDLTKQSGTIVHLRFEFREAEAFVAHSGGAGPSHAFFDIASLLPDAEASSDEQYRGATFSTCTFADVTDPSLQNPVADVRIGEIAARLQAAPDVPKPIWIVVRADGGVELSLRGADGRLQPLAGAHVFPAAELRPAVDVQATSRVDAFGRIGVIVVLGAVFSFSVAIGGLGILLGWNPLPSRASEIQQRYDRMNRVGYLMAPAIPLLIAGLILMGLRFGPICYILGRTGLWIPMAIFAVLGFLGFTIGVGRDLSRQERSRVQADPSARWSARGSPIEGLLTWRFGLEMVVVIVLVVGLDSNREWLRTHLAEPWNGLGYIQTSTFLAPLIYFVMFRALWRARRVSEQAPAYVRLAAVVEKAGIDPRSISFQKILGGPRRPSPVNRSAPSLTSDEYDALLMIEVGRQQFQERSRMGLWRGITAFGFALFFIGYILFSTRYAQLSIPGYMLLVVAIVVLAIGAAGGGRLARAATFEADRFAVDQTGRPDVVIRALTTYYDFLFLPHRFNRSDEVLRPMPSLDARIARIQEPTANAR